MDDSDISDLSSQDELFEHYRFVASKGQEPLRVDKFLMNFIENATRNKIQQAAKQGHIWVNGNQVKQNYRVKAGDEVKVLFEHPPYEFLLTPEDIPLDIVYEDEQVLVRHACENTFPIFPGKVCIAQVAVA